MVGRFVSNMVPVSCALLCVLIANFPITFTAGLLPPPLLALMPVYFWSLVRPDLMSPAWAFMIGIAEDVFSGGPPGIWAASFVATYAVLNSERDTFAGLSGAGAILGFAMAALVTCGTAYAIVSLYYGHFQSLAPVLGELAVTVLFYVPGAYVLGLVHRRLVGPLRSDF